MTRASDAGDTKFLTARDEAQNAAQWVARLSSSYAETREYGDERFALNWDPSAATLTSLEIGVDTRVRLQLPDLTLQFTEDGRPVPHLVEIDGKSPAEIEAWVLVELLHRDFDRSDFRKDLPYRWPKMMSGDETKHEPESVKAELKILCDWLTGAGKVLLALRSKIDAAPLGGAYVIDDLVEEKKTLLEFWPGRFEIGFRMASDDGGGLTRTGFGIGEADDLARPHFFIEWPKRERFSIPMSDVPVMKQAATQIVDRLATELRGFYVRT